MTATAHDYRAFGQIQEEISKANGVGATVATLAMIYVGLDTMALLGCPVGKSQTRKDFIAWVDRYLKADSASVYQYEGVDVYAARCAVLHSYGSVSDLHRKANPPRKFIYMDNGPHREDVQERVVMISVAVLIRDFADAMGRFIEDILADTDLKARVDSRIDSLFIASLWG